MKKTFSKEEKKVYFENLRREWKTSKALAENNAVAKALFREANLKSVSYFGFYYVLAQMQELKLEGLPYIDCKTFEGWYSAGFMVKKGEKSKIKGITWIAPKSKKDEEENDDANQILYPKVYHLFHRSQVMEK